jgi:hypothetical protein
MDALEKMRIVREGVWLYEQSVRIHLRILSSPETWGTGDYEDEDSVAENQQIPCFFLAYEAAGSPGNFCNIVPNLLSFEAAVAFAEQKFPGIKWNET